MCCLAQQPLGLHTDAQQGTAGTYASALQRELKEDCLAREMWGDGVGQEQERWGD